jgi:hypothetical protein
MKKGKGAWRSGAQKVKRMTAGRDSWHELIVDFVAMGLWDCGAFLHLFPDVQSS